MKINAKFYINYEEINEFNFGPYNKLVDVTQYEHKIIPEIPRIISLLNHDKNTRQAVIAITEGIGTKTNMNSCLSTLQFQIANEIKRKITYDNNIQKTIFKNETVLYITATYRSLCERYGQPNDEKMLKYIATLVKRELKNKIDSIDICVQVGNYHRREENFN